MKGADNVRMKRVNVLRSVIIAVISLISSGVRVTGHNKRSAVTLVNDIIIVSVRRKYYLWKAKVSHPIAPWQLSLIFARWWRLQRQESASYRQKHFIVEGDRSSKARPWLSLVTCMLLSDQQLEFLLNGAWPGSVCLSVVPIGTVGDTSRSAMTVLPSSSSGGSFLPLLSRVFLVIVLVVLLLRAGDVELNPGPKGLKTTEGKVTLNSY